MVLRPIVGGNPLDIATRVADALSCRGCAACGQSRSCAAGLREHLPRADVVARSAARGDRCRRELRDVDGARRRTRESRNSSRSIRPVHCTPAVAAGSRSATAIANLLAAQGAEVHREYYLNDAGTQLDLFGASLLARYRGEDVPEDGYRGAYLDEMAARMRAELGDAVTLEDSTRMGLPRHRRPDSHRSRAHRRAFRHVVLRARAARDVVMSPTCSPTSRRGWPYLRRRRRPLAAHHRLRRQSRSGPHPQRRHHDVSLQRPRVPPRQVRPWIHASHRHLGCRPPRPGEVAAIRNAGPGHGPAGRARDRARAVREAREATGDEVRMSKRAGDIITLADILDEVDPDVARMTFLLLSIDSAQTFDLDIVTSQSMENPVYYVQYAHARIASIGRKAAARRRHAPAARHGRPRRCWSHEREDALLRALALVSRRRPRSGRSARRRRR